MTYIAVISGFALFFLTMAIGVMMGRKPIAGSCGGLANVGLNGECKVCGRTPGSCDSENGDTDDNPLPKATSNLAYNAIATDAMAAATTAKQEPETISKNGFARSENGFASLTARTSLDPLDF